MPIFSRRPLSMMPTPFNRFFKNFPYIIYPLGYINNPIPSALPFFQKPK